MFEYLDPSWWLCLGRVGGVALLEEEGDGLGEFKSLLPP